MTTLIHDSSVPVKTPVEDLNDIDVLTLSDLIRFGSRYTEQAIGSWGDGATACTLSAAREELAKRGFVK